MSTYIVLENREHILSLLAFTREYAQHTHYVSVERPIANHEETQMAFSDLPLKVQQQYKATADDVLNVRIHGRTQHQIERVPAPLLPEPITSTRMMTILESFIQEALSTLLAYQKPISAVHLTTCALYGTTRPTEMQLMGGEHFLTEPHVDDIREEVMMEVSRHVGIGSWNEWHVVRTPNVVGLINTNQDHRIREWESQQAFLEAFPAEGVTYRLDDVINHLSTQLTTVLGQQPPISHLYEIVAGGIARLSRNITFVDGTEAPLLNVEQRICQYDAYYADIIEWTIRGFLSTQVANQLKPMGCYNAYITPQGQLHLTETRVGILQENVRYQELRAAVENGDWIPERDRRWLEEYERG